MYQSIEQLTKPFGPYDPAEIEMKLGTPFNEFQNLITLEKSASISPRMRRVIKFIEKRYRRKIRLEDVAVLVRLHPNHLCRTFREEVGMTFHEYVMRLRVKEAIRLLAYSKKSIKVVGYEVGYCRPEMFSKIFKRFVRFTPRQFRKLCR
jgi:AraC-like DNA-binding protein